MLRRKFGHCIANNFVLSSLVFKKLIFHGIRKQNCAKQDFAILLFVVDS